MRFAIHESASKGSPEALQALIFAMAKLMESRCPETGLHLERVREYTRILAQHVAANSEKIILVDFAETVSLASVLHDIGMVSLPDSILLSKTHLTLRQQATMQLHTVLGGEALSMALSMHPSDQYTLMARDIAMYHHERYDGQGYPMGLAGMEIPLAARIVSVADAYDAMTTTRSYHDAMPHHMAHTVIEAGKGKQFDPVVVEAFMAREQEISMVRNRFNAQPIPMAA